MTPIAFVYKIGDIKLVQDVSLFCVSNKTQVKEEFLCEIGSSKFDEFQK